MSTAVKTDTRPLLLASELPGLLKGAYEDLLEALATPLLASWPEDETFLNAPQPKAIAEVLLEELHDHLVNSRIGYLFRETLEMGGETKAATAVDDAPASVDGSSLKQLAEEEARKAEREIETEGSSGPRLHRDGGVPVKRGKGKK
jgi:hypothetical protein